MMYSDKLAVAIKVDGKVLREHGDTVYLPLGCEYSVFVKNMDTRRASVSIKIDGTDIMDGRRLVVDAGGTSEIERFIRNGNLTEGNRLRFIEKTAAVEEYRGNKVEDGLIEIGWQFEAFPVGRLSTVFDKPTIKPYGSPDLYGGYGGGLKGGGDITRSVPTSCAVGQSNFSGITVAGSESKQQFSTTSLGVMDSAKHTMVIRLMGGDAPIGTVKEPVTVKTKLTCTSCGTKSKSTVKFCPECGTALHLT